MVWGLAWLSRTPVVLPSSRLLRLRLRLLSTEVMLEEEVVRERARRDIPADGTRTQHSSIITARQRQRTEHSLNNDATPTIRSHKLYLYMDR